MDGVIVHATVGTVDDGEHLGPVLGKDDGRLLLIGLMLEDGACLRHRLTHDHGDAGLDDAGLLTRDLRQRVAEEARVVEADVGDDAQQRTDDVGAVEPSAESHLDDGDIDLLLLEIEEGHGRGELEERGMEGLEEGALLLYEVDDALAGDGLAVDADALAEVDQMG